MGSQTTTFSNTNRLANNYYSTYNYSATTKELAAKNQSLGISSVNYHTIPTLSEYMVNGTGLYFEESFKTNLGTYALLTFTYNIKPPTGRNSMRNTGRRGHFRRRN